MIVGSTVTLALPPVAVLLATYLQPDPAMVDPFANETVSLFPLTCKTGPQSSVICGAVCPPPICNFCFLRNI